MRDIRSILSFSVWLISPHVVNTQTQTHTHTHTHTQTHTQTHTNATNWKILKGMRIPNHLTCLLKNLYAGQEAVIRTGHGTKDWFQVGKGVHQGCILSPCLFNLHVEYIMWNAELDEIQTGIKIARRNINNHNTQMTPPYGRKPRELRASWWRSKRRMTKLA